MKLVIDISEKEYKKCHDLTMLEYDEAFEFLERVEEVISEAEILPKNYGRLIDAEALKVEICKASNLHKTVGETINDAPTIIEESRQ